MTPEKTSNGNIIGIKNNNLGWRTSIIAF